MARLLSGKAWVCKTHIRGFDSRPRLKKYEKRITTKNRKENVYG